MLLLVTSGTMLNDPGMCQVAHMEYSIRVAITLGLLFFLGCVCCAEWISCVQLCDPMD